MGGLRGKWQGSWGRTWTDTEFSDANFRVRITDVAASTARTFNLDVGDQDVKVDAATGGCLAPAKTDLNTRAGRGAGATRPLFVSVRTAGNASRAFNLEWVAVQVTYSYRRGGAFSA